MMTARLFRTLLLSAALGSSLLPAALPAQSAAGQNIGEITPRFQYVKTTIAVARFAVDNAPVEFETIPRVIREDLVLSGLFTLPTDERAVRQLNLSDHRSGGINFDAWSGMGVDHYLMGRVYTANNRLMAEVLLYDIRTRQLVLRRTVDGPLGNPRFLAHRIADATMLQLKGIEGIFTTKIAYVSEQVPGVKEIAVMDADGFAPTQLTRLGRIATMPTWGSGAAEIYFTSYHGNRAIIYGMQLNLDPSSYTITPGRQWTIAPYGGTNHSPAWSPAARRIAMVLSKDGNSEIYTVLRDGQDLRRVTRTPATEGSPVWSPDGRRIAFTSNEAGGVNLYMMNADGSGRTAITSGGGWNDAVAWSPDGTRLAFVRRQGGRNDIYTFDVLSGSPTGLRRLTQNEGNNESPTWAPNSRHIAFTSDRSGTWQIYLMLDDGSSQRAITKSGRNKIPRWSPQLVR